MTSRLPPLQSKIAAFVLLLSLLSLILGIAGYGTIRLHRHYDVAIEDYMDKLQRYRRIASMRPSIEEAMASVQGDNSRRFYLQSDTPSLASAELQRLLTGIVDKHNGKVTSSQIVAAKEDGKKSRPARVSVLVQLNAGVVPLQMMLHTLESHEPYLFVEHFSVRGGLGRNYKEIPGTQPEFAVQFTVSAYLPPADGSRP